MQLKRRLSLPLLVFYGLGSIIGAGIYVLLGEVAGIAEGGMGIAFLLAGLIAGLTGLSYAELSSRYPLSAGSVLFVDVAFRRSWLSRLMAMALLCVGAISSAVICRGFVGYFQLYLDFDSAYIIVALSLLMFGVASWGIKESAIFIAIITILEIGGLVLVCVVASELPNRSSYAEIFDVSVGLGPIAAAAFIAFYAFIGFEDMVNVAEEVIDAKTVMPLGILLAVAGSSLLYFAVAAVAIVHVDLELLSASSSPLSAMVGHRPAAMHLVSMISMVAILNGAVVQIIMFARVLYGMAERRLLPAYFGKIHPVTHTPVMNTFIACVIVMVLALAFELVELANVTSALMLVIFASVNVSLIKIKQDDIAEPEHFTVPLYVPALALTTTLILLLFQLVAFF